MPGKFYNYTYNNWSALDHHRIDYVMKFEKLGEDFAEVLKLIGIDAKRELPVFNKTKKNQKDPYSYYTPEIRSQAIRRFGPYMKKWGYEFPSDWDNVSTSWLDELEFNLTTIPQKIYWLYLKKHRSDDLPLFLQINPSRYPRKDRRMKQQIT